MNYKTENLFHFSNPTSWLCSIHEVDNDGTVTIVVIPDPPGRSRLHIIVYNTIYYDTHMAWRGCSVNVAQQEEFEKYISLLSTNLADRGGECVTEEGLSLYVIPTTGSDSIFLAKGAVIDRILP